MPTFNEVTYDIMEILRNSNLSDDTDLSERQILYHLDTQRALWIRNEYNKPGRTIDPFIEQDLGCLKLIEVDPAECCEVTTGCTVLRTEKKIPMTIELHAGPAITRVGPVNKINKPFSFTEYQKAIFTYNGKYGKNIVTAFLLNGYIYVLINDINMQTIEYINVRGVFENPRDLDAFKCSDDACFSYDDEYPIHGWMIPYIKEQILKQFGIAMSIPKDEVNDANENIAKQ